MENLTTPSDNLTATPNATEPKYAGFWLRFVAWIIDYLILKTVHAIIFAPLFVMIGFSSLVKLDWAKLRHDSDAGDFDPLAVLKSMDWGAFFIAAFLSASIFVLLYWLYYSILESSSKQATVGKMALGIRVTDMNGNRISFARATGRNFGKIISHITIFIGYIMAGFTEKKQALHDIMADCLVVKK